MSNNSTLARKLQPQDYDVFVGMDVDKRSIALTQVDHLGIERSVSMPHEGATLLSYVGRHLRGRRIAFVYEAGPTGFGLYDTLSQAGYPCLVVTPAAVPTRGDGGYAPTGWTPASWPCNCVGEAWRGSACPARTTGCCVSTCSSVSSI